MPLDLIEAVPTQSDFPAAIESLVKREKLKLEDHFVERDRGTEMLKIYSHKK